MGWQDRLEHYYPETPFPDTVGRANRPNVPIGSKNEAIGLIGTLARGTVSRNGQCDAHVVAWYDWQERAAIIEFDGGLDRRVAEVMASRTAIWSPRHQQNRHNIRQHRLRS